MAATATAAVPTQAICPSEWGTREEFLAFLWAYLSIDEQRLEEFREFGIEPRRCGCGRWMLAFGGRGQR